MARARFRVLFFTFLLIAVVSSGCESNPASPSIPSNPQTETGSWTIYTPYAWTHDGKPYHGQHVTIYSDAANGALKERVAEIADERFDQILALFQFDNVADFRYPPGSSTIDIYINRHHSEGINWAYWGGFIITIRSSDLSGIWYDRAVYTVRHELTHEFEFLIEGREALGTDMWFREGLATHVGCLEPTGWRTIRDLYELESWISQNQSVPGQGNPIRIHQNADFPEGANRHEYFRLSELAVTYILDARGMGRSYQDVLGLFYDVRNGVSFPVSFRDRFGISLGDFEDQVFDRLKDYLGGGP
jgi:hypothetical protein